MKVLSFRKGELVYTPYDEIEGVMVIKEGKVKIYFLDKNGKEISIDILSEGEVFGRFDGLSEEWAECVEDCKIVFISKEEIKKLKPSISAIIIENLIKKNNLYKRRIRDFSFLPLEERTEEIIYYIAQKLGKKSHKYVELSFSHEEIASFVGATRECVTKTLKVLEDKGKVKRKRKKIVLYITEKELENDKNKKLLWQE
ncbi:cAMP-activated global transcriptional regulator CRP [bacterium HR19]|nr:cAMP-activated global transcriptional regulator CRP [bacterium HR19]